MKKVIVTGANGFVGTALCKELSARGCEIIAVVRNKESNAQEIENLPGIRMVYCDLSCFNRLSDYITDRDIDVMYHFAWSGTAGPLRGDHVTQLNNVLYTCDAVRACADLQCKRFVFASSIMEYEIQVAMESENIPSVYTLYSSAKMSANYMAKTIANSLNISYIRGVISNIYGPGETSPRLINSSLRKMLRGERCSFSPGEQTYDFIYIDDAAKAFTAIGEKGHANKTYYIGTLEPKALKEFLCEMRDTVDPSIEIGLGDFPFNGVSLTYHEFDLHAVSEDTGVVPQVPFAEGIRKTMEWIKETEYGKF